MNDDIKRNLSLKIKKIFSNQRGILAVDERPSSMENKLLANEIANTKENRNLLRECIFKTKNIENFIGGVILNEETFNQIDDKGILLIDYLINKDIEIGIKMDKGLIEFNSNISNNEFISIGLEDLQIRLKSFEKASFCKWRSLFNIDNSLSDECIKQNCIVLCKYALIVQRNNKIAIIEPEISINGNYSIDEMRIASKKIYSKIIEIANEMDLFLPGIILKCSFITEGREYDLINGDMNGGINGDMNGGINGGEYKGASGCINTSINSCINTNTNGTNTNGTNNTMSEYSHYVNNTIPIVNINVISETIPRALGAIVFLSGGHPSHQSFDLLRNIHKFNPYKDLIISFSFCRALTDCVLKEFKGGISREKFEEAQKEFIKILEECFNCNK